MGFLFQAFHQLGFGFFCGKTSNFFQTPDMFFLVFFQFRSLDIYQFDLPVQVFLDRFIFFICLSRVPSFWLMRLLFLFNPVFRIIQLFGSFQ